MRVIPKQDSYDAFQFTELHDLKVLIEFVEGDPHYAGIAKATVEVHQGITKVSIEFDGNTYSIGIGFWAIRKDNGIEIAPDSLFQKNYQRAF